MVNLQCLDGTKQNIETYTVKSFPYVKLPAIEVKAKHGRNYQAVFGTFDIETTTYVDDYGKKSAWMYHWQACVHGYVVMGRHWSEWEEFLESLKCHLKLSASNYMVFYIHNAGFEFQFMKDFMTKFGTPEIFAPQPRKPLTMRWEGLEFRCSWKLTNMTLEKACQLEKGVIVGKQAGDLDYRKVRYPWTILTNAELGYCAADVLSLYQLICCKMENDNDSLSTIPLTSTGYVRREVRNACKSSKGYRDYFKTLRLTKQEYTLLKEAARGGDTHANRYYAGRILGAGEAYDVQSSYPYVICAKYYPVTKLTAYGDIDSKKELQELLDTKCCLFRLILKNPVCRREEGFPYIPEAKCQYLSKPILDNGRILQADHLQITVTEIDYQIISEQYTWEEMYISDLHIADRGLLPEPIRRVTLDYFRRKTELKGKLQEARKAGTMQESEDIEYQYNKIKNKINAIFGMMYTDPVRNEITYENSKWSETTPDIDEALEAFYRNKNSFLYYAWGVWTTAQARMHLNKLRSACGSSAAYCDTDSIYAVPACYEKVEALNREIVVEAERTGNYAEYKGKKYYLGIYELDKEFDRFKTLGAKKYAYDNKDGFHITISGVEKKAGALEMGRLENFIPGFTFYKAGGLEATYIESCRHKVTVHGNIFETGSSIAMTEGTYELGITGEYAEIIGYNIYNDLDNSALQVL